MTCNVLELSTIHTVYVFCLISDCSPPSRSLLAMHTYSLSACSNSNLLLFCGMLNDTLNIDIWWKGYYCVHMSRYVYSS